MFDFFLSLLLISTLSYWTLFSMIWVDKGHNVDLYLLFGFFLIFLLLLFACFRYYRSRCRLPAVDMSVEAVTRSSHIQHSSDSNVNTESETTVINPLQRCDAMLDINKIVDIEELERDFEDPIKWPFLDEKRDSDS